MSKLGENAWLVVMAAQHFVGTGDREQLAAFPLERLRQTERELGRQGAGEAWRRAIQSRVKELRARRQPDGTGINGIPGLLHWLGRWL